MKKSNPDLIESIVRTDDGRIYKEYRLGTVAYGSINVLETALEAY